MTNLRFSTKTNLLVVIPQLSDDAQVLQINTDHARREGLRCNIKGVKVT